MWSGKAGEEEKVGEVKGVVEMVMVVKRAVGMVGMGMEESENVFVYLGGWMVSIGNKGGKMETF